MQEEMIHEIERARPKYLISVVMFYSWLWRRHSATGYIYTYGLMEPQKYAAAGLVNITSTETDYNFGDIPPSVGTLKNYILIYERKR